MSQPNYSEPQEDEEQTQTSATIPFFLMALSCSAWAILVMGASSHQSTPYSNSWMAVALLAEALAPCTEGLGFVPWAAPVYFVLASASGGLSRNAAVTPLFALVLRTLLRGSSDLGKRLVEFSSDLICLVVMMALIKISPLPTLSADLNSAAAWKLWPWLLPLGAYWFAWTVVPVIFQNAIPSSDHRQWTLARERVHPTLLFLLTFGLASSLSSALPWTWNFTAPVLLLTIIPAGRAQAQLWSLEAEQRRGRTARRLLAKDQQQVELEQRRTLELTRKAEKEEERAQSQKVLFENVGNLFVEMTRAWGQGFSGQFLGTIRQRIPAQTMILFVRRQKLQTWERVSWHGRETDRFDVLLPELDRSLIGEALRSQSAKLCRPNESLSLDRNEAELAIPIDRWGVFYVSDPDLNLLQNHQQLLTALAPHLRIYVDASAYYQSQQEALESEASLRKRTEEIARRLAAVLKSLASLVGEIDPVNLLDESLLQISQLVPCQAAAVVWNASETQQIHCCLPHDTEVWPQLQQNLECWQSDKAWTRQTGTFNNQECQWWPVAMLNGTLALVELPDSPLEDIDLEVLRLFVWQAERLLENATLYTELQQSNDDLHKSQAQLIQSSKLAAIGQLAAGVAHELNTPLGAISVAIDGALMVLTTKPDRSKQRLEKALLSIEQMQQIISKLLFYSRESRSGRQTIDVKVVVESSIQLVGHVLHLDNIEVQFYPGPPCKVMANPNELQQVFTNLLINAKDACLSPGASGKVIAIRSYSSGERVGIEISDSGCGMDPGTLDRIFEPFFTTKDVGQGTGLGLSTSLLIVQEHQGALEVESELGRGTTFRILLPVAK